ncbi:MAG TPA: SDR family oxidoreductase [Candidatus Angelobacter sp.]|nr:SDR family oxidoreductase [Candidatus Angelobacter sp.]
MTKTALITGASAGLGVEFARLFAKDSVSLVLVARREDRLQQLKSELETGFGVRADSIPLDLTLPDSASTILDFLQCHQIQVEYLVNNAGFGQSGSFSDISLNLNLAQIDLNARSLTELTHRLLPSMIKNRSGRILNVGSTAGDQPGPFMAVYYASKAYVNSFSEALHYELKGTGVTVTLSCPGPTFTEFPEVAQVKNKKLFQMNAMPSDVVARQAYRAMMRGARRITHGGRNKIGSQVNRLAPRSTALKIVAVMNSPK